MTAVPAAISVLLAAAFGWAVPAIMMRALAPALDGGALGRPNFRGRTVVPYLGLAWVVWALALVALQGVLDLLLGIVAGTAGFGEVAERFWTTPLALPYFVVPFMLVTGSAVLGLADDAFGGAHTIIEGTAVVPRGFTGHLGALRRGTATTGMLKMLGIGALALFYGVSAAEGVLERSVLPEAWTGSWVPLAMAALLAALVIALSANLLNLLDVRPGRALKAYLVLVPAPAVALALSTTASYNEQIAGFAAETGMVGLSSWEATAVAVALVLVLIGPALAVYRFDLGERAMLGDAGSNAMGAIVGYLLTAVLSFWGLAAVAAVLLFLNLLSERLPFSVIIERVAVLRWLDGLGRARATDAVPNGAAEASAPLATVVRYHSDVGDGEGED